MLSIFVFVFLALILTELVKGLSANGTPPVLQKLSWQIDLAHVMWSNISWLRVLFVLGLIVSAALVPESARLFLIVLAVPLAAAWYGIYWLFNRFWVGKYKFPLIQQKMFTTADSNELDLSLQVLGVEVDGVAKAYPVNMVFWHHQIPDEIAGQPIWVTYCGLCRSGRVYDLNIDGQTLDFTLVGAVNFNAVFSDNQTGTWWRQETGEAAKGPLSGKILDDVPFAQMSLESWLAIHPNSEILQYDPAFTMRYGFIDKLLKYEASLPGWHMQERPAMVTGVEVDGKARAYDWDQLQKRGHISDMLGGTPLLVVAKPGEDSGFVFDRSVDDQALDFEATNDGFIDSQTGSNWNHFGQCVDGAMAGKKLVQLQSYQQFVRAWIEFHKDTDFFEF